MPQLREWMLHFPTDWTAVQAHGYVQDVTMAFVNAINPVMQAVGPERACAVLLTCLANIVRANPVYHENIKDLLASTYDLVVQIDPLKGATKQ